MTKKTPDQLYFSMQAEMGLTKHMGGKTSTKELIDLCHITENSLVLDVGCGTGKTSCFLAKEVGCKITAVDLYQGMIDKALKRAKRKKVSDKIEFRQADAVNLPFKNNFFDIIISESVTAFVSDKQKALNEYFRVLKPNGFVGLNELTWQGNPPQKVIDFMHKTMGGEFFSVEEWKKFLVNANFKEIQVKFFEPNAFRQFKDEISWFELRDFVNPWHKVIMLFIKDKEYRDYFKSMLRPPRNISKYMAHGIYVGQK